MIRRAVCAIAAVFAAMLLVLTPGVPAFADPEPVKPLCTVPEWQDPRNFVDCSKRAAAATQRQVDCIKAPTPSSPDAGIGGWVTSRPDSDLRAGVTGRYSQYGVGGYRLSLYDVSCAASVTAPVSSFETELASLAFGGASFIVGGSNTLRELAYDPGTMWGWADGFVQDATQKTYEYVFSVFGVLSLALGGLWLLVQARKGELSKAMQTAGWAVLVMVALAGLVRYPTTSVHAADTVALTGLTTMHNVLGPGPHNIPLDKCVLGGTNPDACIDHRTVAVRSADTITESVLYRNWLRAELGSADSAVAKKYGAALFDASTFSWAEAAKIDAQPELRQIVIDEKAKQWISIAAAIKTEDPEAYQHLQGVQGSDRIWAGLAALFTSLVYVLFDNAASLMILLSFGLLRVAVISAPILATAGILLPASGPLRRMFNAAVAAVFNIAIFGAGSGLYLLAVDYITKSSLPGGAQVIAVLLTGVAGWLALRPIRRIVRMNGRSKAPADGESPSTDRTSWLRKAASWAGAAATDVAKQAAADAATRRQTVWADGEAGPRRPEARASLTSGRAGGRR